MINRLAEIDNELLYKKFTNKITVQCDIVMKNGKSIPEIFIATMKTIMEKIIDEKNKKIYEKNIIIFNIYNNSILPIICYAIRVICLIPVFLLLKKIIQNNKELIKEFFASIMDKLNQNKI